MRVRLDPPHKVVGGGAIPEVPPGLGFTYPLARGVYFRTLARRGGILPPTDH